MRGKRAAAAMLAVMVSLVSGAAALPVPAASKTSAQKTKESAVKGTQKTSANKNTENAKKDAVKKTVKDAAKKAVKDTKKGAGNTTTETKKRDTKKAATEAKKKNTKKAATEMKKKDTKKAVTETKKKGTKKAVTETKKKNTKKAATNTKKKNTKKAATETKKKDAKKATTEAKKKDTKKDTGTTAADTKGQTTGVKAKDTKDNADTKKETTTSAAKAKDKTILNTDACDFTGDGKKDTVKVVAVAAENGSAENGYMYSGVEVYLNGRLGLISSKVQGNTLKAKAAELADKTFLVIEASQENDLICTNVYGYKNGVVTLYLNGEQMISTKKKDGTGGSVRDYGYGYFSSAKDNTITFKAAVWSPTVGNYECEVPFVYANKKLKRSGRTYTITSLSTKRKDGKLKALKNITGYKKPDGAKSVKLKKGKLYRPDKVWIKNEQVYYHIPLTNEKVKAVWVKGITFKQYDKSLNGGTAALFKNIVLAG